MWVRVSSCTAHCDDSSWTACGESVLSGWFYLKKKTPARCCWLSANRGTCVTAGCKNWHIQYKLPANDPYCYCKHERANRGNYTTLGNNFLDMTAKQICANLYCFTGNTLTQKSFKLAAVNVHTPRTKQAHETPLKLASNVKLTNGQLY